MDRKKTLIFSIALIIVLGMVFAIFTYVSNVKQGVKGVNIEKDVLEYCDKNAVINPSCLAIAARDINLCNKYKEDKWKTEIEGEQAKKVCIDEYYFFIAIQENDVELCKNIKIDTFKIPCYSFLNQDVSFCEGVNKSFEQLCIAMATSRNENLCNDLGEDTPFDKRACIEGMKIFNALFYNNQTFCEGITHKSNKAFCLALTNKEPSFCYKGLTECYDTRYSLIAFNQKDLNLCQNVINQHMKDICFDSVYEVTAINANNIDLCNNIINETSRENCESTIKSNLGGKI